MFVQSSKSGGLCHSLSAGQRYRLHHILPSTLYLDRVVVEENALQCSSRLLLVGHPLDGDRRYYVPLERGVCPRPRQIPGNYCCLCYGESLVSWHGLQVWWLMASESMSACIVLFVTAIIRGWRMRTARTKAQRLVLACAYFDKDGKLMVTEQGILPSESITDHYLEKVEVYPIRLHDRG